jgi:hypothetical protein
MSARINRREFVKVAAGAVAADLVPKGRVVGSLTFGAHRISTGFGERHFWIASVCPTIHELGGRLLIGSSIKVRPQCRRKPCIGRPRTVPPIISDRDPGSPIRHYNA